MTESNPQRASLPLGFSVRTVLVFVLMAAGWLATAYSFKTKVEMTEASLKEKVAEAKTQITTIEAKIVVINTRWERLGVIENEIKHLREDVAQLDRHVRARR